MNSLGKQLSAGTQHFAAQAVVAAQAAGATIAAGLRTCDEKSGGSLSQFEIRIDPSPCSQDRSAGYASGGKNPDAVTAVSCFNQFPSYDNKVSTHDGGLISTLLNAITVPSTALALPATDGANRVSSTTNSSGTPAWGTPSFELNLDIVSHGPSAGCLVASARRVYRNGPNGSLSTSSSVPIRCRWKRKIAGQLFDIPNASGTEYPITADDVASQIVVEARAVDSPDQGVAYAECGPFELDAAFRKHLDDYLAVGNTRFPVHLHSVISSENSPGRTAGFGGNPKAPSWLTSSPRQPKELASVVEDQDEELVLHVSGDAIKVVKPGPKNLANVREWSCGFGADYPRVILNYTDLTGFELRLNSSTSLHLHATTRSQRDLLTLSIRCFHARQWTANSLLLQHAALAAGRLASNSTKTGDGASVPPSPSPELLAVDIFAVVQRLNAELYRCLEHQEKSIRERDRAQIEKDALEEDITATIGAYQQLLAEGHNADPDAPFQLDSNTIPLEIKERAARIAELETRLKEAHEDVEKYRAEVDRCRRECHALKAAVETNDLATRPGLARRTTGRSSEKLSGANLSQKSEHRTDALPHNNGSHVEKEVELLQQQNKELRQQCDAKSAELAALQTRLSATHSLQNGQHRPNNLNDRTNAPCFHRAEAAHKKEETEKQLVSLKADNKKLAENVLYMKSKYDNLVATSTRISCSSSRNIRSNVVQRQAEDHVAYRDATNKIDTLENQLKVAQNQLSKLEEELSTVSTERNRYAKKIEVLTKDLEKTQSLFEAKTASLSALNKQTLEEKMSNEEALQKALNTALSKSAAAAAEAAQRSQEKITTLEELLAQKTAELEKVEKTNETLRSRLRKLAADAPSIKAT